MTILTVAVVIIAVQLFCLAPYVVRASLSNEQKLACETSPISKLLSDWEIVKIIALATGCVWSFQLIGFIWASVFGAILSGGHA